MPCLFPVYLCATCFDLNHHQGEFFHINRNEANQRFYYRRYRKARYKCIIFLVIFALNDVFTWSTYCLRLKREGENCKGNKYDILKLSARLCRNYVSFKRLVQNFLFFSSISLWPMFASPDPVINLSNCDSAFVLQSFAQFLLHFHSVTF